MNRPGLSIHAFEEPQGLVAETSPVENCALVIFGGSGDLTIRKIIPALHRLSSQNHLPSGFEIIVFARSLDSLPSFKERLLNHLREESQGDFDSAAWDRLASHISIIRGNYDTLESYTMLRERLVSIERSGDTAGNRFFYLATPAESFPAIVRRLRDANLIYDNRSKIHSAWSRVVIEKPFGRNLASARELNNLVSCVLDESQTYRIDHFLGKETVQNILVLRFGNSIFEPVWNRKNISFVEITVAETLGIENRGQYYDRAGVLRDMVQNHLMQLLALCAMEQPARFGAEEIRDEKAKVLHSMRPFEATSIHHNLVLGQYQGYQQERNIAVNSLTPTFAAMRVEIANWRWQGIPFYLRTGKCLRNKVSEIVLHFLPVPLCLFGLKDVCHHVKPNVLVLRIQPNEGISLRMSCKVPGENLAVGTVSMNFSYQEAFRKPGGDAYERLLLDVMRGNATLFSRRDEVELAWEYLDPILESCENGGGPALHSYPKGSDGPAAANELVTRSGHSWKEFA